MFRKRKPKDLTQLHVAALQADPQRAASSEAAQQAELVRAQVLALRDPDERNRRDAATALGQLGDPGAVYPLSALLETSREIDGACYAAIEALGLLGGEDAEATLTAALRDLKFWGTTYFSDDHRNLGVEAIARALGRIGSLPAILRGHLLAAQDPAERIRMHNLHELGNVLWRSQPTRPDVYGDGGRVLRESDLDILVEPIRLAAEHDPVLSIRYEAESLLKKLKEMFPDSSHWGV